MNLYEIYLFSNRQERQGRQGHVSFVVGTSVEEAWHTAAKSIPRIWQSCGIREAQLSELNRRITFLRSEVSECESILKTLSEIRNN